MNKPKKKKETYFEGKLYINPKDESYNQAIDDYEAFLPSEEEIRNLLIDKYDKIENKENYKYGIFVDLAKAISKRIRG